jgi:hypothetical protein
LTPEIDDGVRRHGEPAMLNIAHEDEEHRRGRPPVRQRDGAAEVTP